MYDDYFSKAHELSQSGRPFATAVVVRAEKPTSGKPGDKAIITLDGVMYGWIGGSCAQPAVVEAARAAMREDRGRLIRLTPNPGQDPPSAGIEEVAMTCYSGGTLDVYIEPQQPRPQLLIVGNLPVAQALAHLGKAMNYRVIAVDLAEGGRAMRHADEVLARFDKVSERVTPLTYAVVATHGHFDEEALEHLLKTSAPYVGLVASRKRAKPIRQHLTRLGLGGELRRLHAPAGLDIQAQRGDEIALSIMAQIVKVRRNTEHLAWRNSATTAQPAEAESKSSCCAGDTSTSSSARDPICGMMVEIPDARHVFEYQGEKYYFCCVGCLNKFAADPDTFLPRAHPEPS